MAKRPFHLPTDINAEAEEKRYVHAAFPSFVFLVITEEGHIRCLCENVIRTPIFYNPVTGRWEKMGVVPGCYGGHGICPSCGIEFSLTRLQARKHNFYWDKNPIKLQPGGKKHGR